MIESMVVEAEELLTGCSRKVPTSAYVLRWSTGGCVPWAAAGNCPGGIVVCQLFVTSVLSRKEKQAACTLHLSHATVGGGDQYPFNYCWRQEVDVFIWF